MPVLAKLWICWRSCTSVQLVSKSYTPLLFRISHCRLTNSNSSFVGFSLKKLMVTALELNASTSSIACLVSLSIFLSPFRKTIYSYIIYKYIYIHFYFTKFFVKSQILCKFHALNNSLLYLTCISLNIVLNCSSIKIFKNYITFVCL